MNDQEKEDFKDILLLSLNMERDRQDRTIFETIHDEFIVDEKIKEELEKGKFIFPDVEHVKTDKRILIRRQDYFSAKIHIPDSALYFHKHDFVELLYMYKGRCLQFVENLNTVIELHEGDLFMLNQNVIHGLLQQEKEAILIKVIIPIEWMENQLIQHLDKDSELYEFWVSAKSQKYETYFYLHYFKCIEEKRLIEKMMTEYYLKKPYYKEVIRNYLQLLMLFLDRQPEKPHIGKYKRLHSALEMGKITQYIYEHSDTITLGELAKVFSFNASYLSRMIRESCQMNFQDLLKEIRLEKAMVLLTSTKDSIEAIAQLVGYSHATPLYKGIKEKFGMSPNEYRSRFKR